MRRLIEREIKRPLADLILFGPLKRGGVVTVDMDSRPPSEWSDPQGIGLDLSTTPASEAVM